MKSVKRSACWARTVWGPIAGVALVMLFVSGCGSPRPISSSETTPSRSDAPASISLDPSVFTAKVGTSTSIRAVAHFADGTSQDVSTSANWSSSDNNVAAISSTGIISCDSVGAFSLVALFRGVSGQATVSCLPSSTTLTQQPWSTVGEEFVGPFASWVNVKTVCGAVGDGIHDDTKALQCGLDSLGMTWGKPTVLWIPAGTYRITQTLTISNKIGDAIIGECPTDTTIVWAGQPGGTMLKMMGDKRFKVSRISWDGQGIADTGHTISWDGVSTYPGGWGAFPTANTESDEIFTGLAAGIRIGFAGETSIERVRFEGMTFAGVSTEDFNALDIWIRDSYFDHCARGVTNTAPTVGAGHFHVYTSVFLSSSVADLNMANTSYFGFRGNMSIGSAAFVKAGGMGINANLLTVQNNLIIDPTGTPFVIGSSGSLMLIDNTILLPSDADYPLVVGTDWSPFSSNVFAIGNTYSGNAHYSGSIGQSLSIDNNQVIRSSYTYRTPVPAPFRPNFHRAIVEVPPNAGTAMIQALIDRAAGENGSRPIIHFANASYSIDHTLVIPPNSDLQLVGEGQYSSRLIWEGTSDSPMLQFEGPVRATIRDMWLEGGTDAIEVEANDIPGSRVVLSQVDTSEDDTTGLFVDGLNQIVVESRSSGIEGSEEGTLVDGGITTAGELALFGRVSIFGGGNEAAQDEDYNVRNDGTLTVQDAWHDGADGMEKSEVNLTGLGNVMMQSGFFYFPNSETPFQINGFSGNVDLIGFQFAQDVGIEGDSSGLNFLALGNLGSYGRVQATLFNQSVGGRIGQTLNFELPVDGIGNAANDTGFVRQMISLARHLRPDPMLSLAPGMTDFRMQHVVIEGAANAIHIIPEPAPTSPIVGYQFASDLGQLVASGDRLSLTSNGAEEHTTWKVLRTADGSYEIDDPVTDELLNADLFLRSPTQSTTSEWFIDRTGAGTFTICNASSGLCLAAESPGPEMRIPGSPELDWRLVPTT